MGSADLCSVAVLRSPNEWGLTFVDGLEDWADRCDFVQSYYEYGLSVVASTVPTVSSNDSFAYGMFGGLAQGAYSYSSLTQVEDYAAFSMLILAPNGLLAPHNAISEVDPLPQPVPNGYEALYVPVMSKADPANHLAVLMFPIADYWENFSWPLQLASYTINNVTGSIVSTNTWKNMPIPQLTGSAQETG